MDAGLLNTVTCYYNPIRWEARLRTCKQHLEHLLDTGSKPLLVECQTGDRPFELADFRHIRHVGVRSKTLLWNKESLLRIGMQRLDPDWEYVCWTDADITFRKPDWAYETVHALQIYDVIQPWSDAYDLGPGDAHIAVYKSFLHQFWHGHSCVYGVPPAKSAFERRIAGLPSAKASDPVQVAKQPGPILEKHHHKPHHPHNPKPTDPSVPCYCPPCPPCVPYYGMVPPAQAVKMPWWKRDGGPHEYPHTGYAWAATRRAVEALGGLFEIAAMGAGDYHMALALVGYADRSMPGNVHPAYRKHLMEWQERALRDINFNLGYIPGTIEHSWHGRKSDRRYIDRWQIILEHDFDPDTDIMHNSNGVLELTCRKPKLRHDLDVYLRQRNEDANIL
jgi:hypothetical protein